MPFFRDEIEPDPYFLYEKLPDNERIENARWLYSCGWYVDAFNIIHSIAKNIPDEDTRPKETTDNYEETRFAKSSNKENERAGGGPEGVPDAGHDT